MARLLEFCEGQKLEPAPVEGDVAAYALPDCGAGELRNDFAATY